MKPVYIEKIAATFEKTAGGYSLKEPDYKLLISNATLRRRMSRIVRMGVTIGLQCLEGTTSSVDAILTATGLGCLADTEKFMNTILDHNEELLAPTVFIQSTFNTVGAQIVLLTGNHSYNNTYVHRAFSLESALLDGIFAFAGERGFVCSGRCGG
ncbi:MAG: beta-ketoacyl synthase chain length factor [Parabacteroides sp.]|nr:beta-ketoacyl synthase chain length factor [Parabacteroides sp.]